MNQEAKNPKGIVTWGPEEVQPCSKEFQRAADPSALQAPYILEDQGINSSHCVPVPFRPTAQPQALLLEPSPSF